MAKAYASRGGIPFVDFYSAMVDGDGMLKDGLSNDGVHPTPAGYAVMAPLVASALGDVLSR